jgi:hypothetical protein
MGSKMHLLRFYKLFYFNILFLLMVKEKISYENDFLFNFILFLLKYGKRHILPNPAQYAKVDIKYSNSLLNFSLTSSSFFYT